MPTPDIKEDEMKYIRAFTLIELLTTLCIATLLMLIATPTLNSVYQQVRADSGIRRIQQTLQLARNSAISYGLNVTACPLVDNACNADWQKGFFVFIDNGERNKLDGTDRIIYTTDAFDAQDIVQYNRASVRFQSDGLASGSNGTLKYCPGDNRSPYSRALVINQAGRVRFSTLKDISCSAD
jgi:type IV fimbrial biogenesis protein FimT